MRVAFFGTPEFALPSLQKLQESNHDLVGCVTAPDKPRGRGRSVIATPVAEMAEAHGLPLLKPADFSELSFLADLQDWQADLFAVVAFRILPEAVFGMPRYGAINLHGSLLPKYRGAAPIQWALWNGDTETGVTTFSIRQKVDTGNILKQAKVEILDED
ncbi:methionyl-tRNA formyltransferase, partial [bacterium]|nr:methionyl-tRNA formyltransferase [bacterium]